MPYLLMGVIAILILAVALGIECFYYHRWLMGRIRKAMKGD